MAIYRGPGGAGDATVDATNAAAEVALKTQEAVDAATAAAASAAEAAASAVIASDGLDGIAAYAAAASGSAAAASTSASNASSSASSASTSASNASTSASNASSSASSASSSASSASSSASAASTSASNAATSASNASSSASSASTSAANAASSALDAANSAAAAEGYLPSFTGNNGKYLKTNGTSALWATVDALPSQTGNSGKYLTTNGTAASWVDLNVDPATPLVDGIVYGKTDSTGATWSGTLTNNGNYMYYADYGNYNLGFPGSSAVGIAAAAGNVVVGQGITINDGTTTRDFGVITGITVADPTYIVTSLQPYGNPLIDTRYCATMVLTGTNGGNVGLGYNTFDSLNNGDNNTVIGHNAGGSIIDGSNNVVIGYNSDTSTTSVSNEVTLGNSSHTKTRLFGALAVGGSSTGTSGQVLTSGGSGSAPSWTTLSIPVEATSLVDGIVYGKTDATGSTWSGTINNSNGSNPSGYYELVNCSTQAILTLTNGSPFANACSAGQVVVGQQISINDGTSTLSFGTVVSVDGSSGQYLVTTSTSGWGSVGVTLKYIYQVIITGVNGGNVGIGYNTYDSLTDGDNNTVIGYNAGGSITDGSNNIVIGYNADTSSTSVSNEVTIGNASITKTRLRGAILVGNSSPSAGTSGQVLTSNGASSEPSWTTITSSGTVTSVALTAPTGLTVTGSPVTTSGTLALSYTAGYSIPTDTKQTNWDTAYGWGNHASAGYLTSATAASTYAPLTGTGTSGTWGISITGNAATVTNGLYSTGSYSNPTWLTSVSGSIVSGNISGNAANVTGTVAVANGGTGSTSLTANNVLLGNGTSALQVVAPGTNGNVLTSNGTTWVSSAPSGGSQWTTSGSNIYYNTGNVGIGTSSPSTKLHISGTDATMTIQGTRGTGGTHTIGASGANNDNLNIISAASLIFSPVSTERMRLDSSGNLGLGVTPSAWGSIFKAVQGSGGGALAFRTDAANIDLFANAYYNGTNFIYQKTGYAALRYRMEDGGTIAWFNAPSGTAGNTITFTQAMTLDANGWFGVGATAPLNSNYKFSVVGARTNLAANSSALNLYLQYSSATNGFFIGSPSADALSFSDSNGTERARIDASGNFLVGTTSKTVISGWTMSANAIIGNGSFAAAGGMGINSTSSTGTQYFIGFGRGGSNCGSITSTTTNSTSYLTSSDYRLKENVQPMIGALEKVAQLKPCTYTWKEDGTSGQGFIAHELQAIVPEAVSGEKDAIDVEGNPRYQGVDTSFLVATLTAAIQELKAEFDAYKAAHP